jgi:L-iditol 2-dehydrogenase
VSVNLGMIQMKNLEVKGCIGSPGVWPAAIRFLERTGLDLSPIQTHEFALTEAVEAFRLGADPQACIKVTLLAA